MKVQILCLLSILFSNNNILKTSAQKVQQNEWKFAIHIDCENLKCYGLLISTLWILTSASCLSLGTCSVVYIPTKFLPVHRNIDHSVIHPKYEELLGTSMNEKFPLNDLALMKLKRPFDINAKIQLPFADAPPKRNMNCKILVDRGQTLMETTVRTFIDCRQIRTLFNVPNLPYEKIEDICDQISVSIDFSTGEIIKFGTPMVCNGNIFGLYSTTISDDSLKISAWTHPFAYNDWIQMYIGNSSDVSGSVRQNTGSKMTLVLYNSYGFIFICILTYIR